MRTVSDIDVTGILWCVRRTLQQCKFPQLNGMMADDAAQLLKNNYESIPVLSCGMPCAWVRVNKANIKKFYARSLERLKKQLRLGLSLIGRELIQNLYLHETFSIFA